MESKPGRSDVLLALRILADIVGQGLESMTGEHLHGMVDDGNLLSRFVQTTPSEKGSKTHQGVFAMSTKHNKALARRVTEEGLNQQNPANHEDIE